MNRVMRGGENKCRNIVFPECFIFFFFVRDKVSAGKNFPRFLKINLRSIRSDNNRYVRSFKLVLIEIYISYFFALSKDFSQRVRNLISNCRKERS